MRHFVVTALSLTVALTIGAPLHVSAQGRGRAGSEARRSRANEPRVERQVPFSVGETLTYDVTWSLLTAGTLVTSVKEKRPSFDSTAYYVVAEGRPSLIFAKLYPVFYKLDTLIDAFTLLAQRGSVYSEERGQHRLRTTTFDRATAQAHFEYSAATTTKTSYPVPPAAQDALSAIYFLRTSPLKTGARLTLPISDNGLVYKVRLEVSAPEPVAVPFGNVSAWKVRPTILDDKNQPVGRNIAVWLSDDARRLPVKLQGDLSLGGIVLTLREAR